MPRGFRGFRATGFGDFGVRIFHGKNGDFMAIFWEFGWENADFMVMFDSFNGDFTGFTWKNEDLMVISR